MKKTFKMKLASILGAAALLFAGSAMLNMQTVSADTYTLKLAGANIEMDTDTSLMFAVSTNIAYENVQLLVWDEAPAEYTVESANGEMKLTNPTTRVINDAEYAVFTKQLLAKQMTDTFYLCAYANVEGVEYYSEPIKYSILEYAYTKLGYTGEAATTKENLIPLIEAMLNYGAAAQTYAGYKTDALATADFVYVEVANATFADGFNYGLYKAGTPLEITPDENYSLSGSADNTKFSVDGEGNITFTVPNETFVNDEAFVAQGDPEVVYVENGEGYKVVVNNGPLDKTEITIPETYNGKAINAIDQTTFAGNTVTTVYYDGTFDNWNAIEGTAAFESATVYCLKEKTYTFNDYPAGTQYAANEEHVLDDYVTVTTTDCHFTSQLRIYSSDTNNGYAIISTSNVKAIKTLSFSAGNKVDTLNVYGSTNNGATWTLIEGVAITSTSYKDYSLNIPNGYTWLKLDVEGSNQVRIESFSLEMYATKLPEPVEPTDEEKVTEAASNFELDFTSMEGAAEKTLPMEAGEATIAWGFVGDHANATLDGNVLTTTNPEEDTTFILKATLTVGEATAEKEFVITLTHVEEGGEVTPPEGGEEPAEPATVTVSIADYADANGWANSTQYSSLKMDENITVTASGGGNTGKYYTSGENWRIYQNEKPSITVTAAEGKTIASVKITYTVNNTGVLTYNGTNITSGTVVDVNAQSITFGVGNTGSATNGQVRITAIEVIYQ